MTEVICFIRGFDHADLAVILAALIAAAVAVEGYRRQQREQRRVERSKIYADALSAVEDYIEAPYRVIRRERGPDARERLTNHINDVQSRLAYHQALLNISASPQVADAYREYVAAARAEAGRDISRAWKAKTIRQDHKSPLGTALRRNRCDAARGRIEAAMRKDVGPRK